MLSIFDLVPDPAFIEAPEVVETARSTPWIFAYAAIGAIIVIAVLIVVKLIVKSNRKKTK